MRLARTPDSWRPQGAVLRRRSFDHLGYPVFSIGFGVVGLCVAVFAGIHNFPRVASPYPHVDWPAAGIGFVALLIGLACLVAAANRLLRGWDWAIEIDSANRLVLALSAFARPTILPFHSIQAIGVRRSDVRYTSGRHKVLATVLALPSGTELFLCSGENMVSRDAAVGRAGQIAAEVARALGVPVLRAGA